MKFKSLILSITLLASFAGVRAMDIIKSTVKQYLITHNMIDSTAFDHYKGYQFTNDTDLKKLTIFFSNQPSRSFNLTAVWLDILTLTNQNNQE
jgi:hypothetical protein